MRRARAALGVVIEAIALLGGCAHQEPARERLIGVSWKGEFIEDDPLAGAMRTVGHTGFTRLNSLAVLPDGRVVSATRGNDGGPATLIEIDPETGAGRKIVDLVGVNDVRALAALPDGWLYAITAASAAEHFRNTFVRIDIGTGLVQSMKDLGRRGIQSLTELNDRTVCGYSTRDGERGYGMGLVWIDTVTGEATVNLDRVDTRMMIQSMAMPPRGNSLIGVSSGHRNNSSRTLVTIDLVTSDTTVLRSMRNWDVRGIAFLRR